MRTIGAVDLTTLRRETAVISDMMTASSVMRITSAEGTDLTIDIEGMPGERDDGYLWDPDTEGRSSRAGRRSRRPFPGWCCPWAGANGVVAVDGFILYEPSYDHETPKTPLLLTIEESWITGIGGDPMTSDRLRRWLARLGPGPFRVSRTGPREHRSQPARDDDPTPGVRGDPGRPSCSAGATARPWPGSSGPGWRASPRRCTGTARRQRPTIDIGDRRVVEDGWVQDLS